MNFNFLCAIVDMSYVEIHNICTDNLRNAKTKLHLVGE